MQKMAKLFQPQILQKCQFWMGSYIHRSDILNFRLVKMVVDATEETTINLEYIPTFSQLEMNLTYSATDAVGVQRSYSLAGFTLTLKRVFIKHLLSYYFPSSIMVAVSWTSFIIPPEVIPARMALLITVLLVLVNLLGTIIDKQPPSTFPTSLVIWMSVCIVFASGALVAYGVLLRQKQTRKKKQRTEQSLVEVTTAFEKTQSRPQSKGMGITYTETDKNDISVESTFDNVCLRYFPIAFLLFNIIYWPTVASLRRPLKF